MQAMILAAGFGTRLLPHTLVRPKPLFPVLNKPLLLLTIMRLQRFGFDHIVVNCHFLREQIVAALSGLPGVVVQEEETILGTGGGLRRALAQLRDEPLLVCNGDIYHTLDCDTLYHEHCRRDNKVTLAMHHLPRFNSVVVADDKVVHFPGQRVADGLAFTGIHVLDPEILESLPDRAFSCIIDHYRMLIRQRTPIAVWRCDNSFWTDMGTPEDYLTLHHGLLVGNIPRWPELGEESGPFLIDSAAGLAEGVQLRDWACIGSAVIGQGAVVQGSVVWDGAEVVAGSSVTGAIVTPAAEVRS
jgi:NDP-sugar pyrophosphorylase family protein